MSLSDDIRALLVSAGLSVDDIGKVETELITRDLQLVTMPASTSMSHLHDDAKHAIIRHLPKIEQSKFAQALRREDLDPLAQRRQHVFGLIDQLKSEDPNITNANKFDYFVTFLEDVNPKLDAVDGKRLKIAPSADTVAADLVKPLMGAFDHDPYRQMINLMTLMFKLSNEGETVNVVLRDGWEDPLIFVGVCFASANMINGGDDFVGYTVQIALPGKVTCSFLSEPYTHSVVFEPDADAARLLATEVIPTLIDDTVTSRLDYVYADNGNGAAADLPLTSVSKRALLKTFIDHLSGIGDPTVWKPPSFWADHVYQVELDVQDEPSRVTQDQFCESLAQFIVRGQYVFKTAQDANNGILLANFVDRSCPQHVCT